MKLGRRRIPVALLGLFAVLSLLLAATGIYGVVSPEVASRLKELAIRIALGARPVEVFGLVIRHGATLAAADLLPGVADAFALTRFLETMLLEVESTDPATFATAVITLSAVALLAWVIPARRATRVDPIVWLRQEYDVSAVVPHRPIRRRHSRASGARAACSSRAPCNASPATALAPPLQDNRRPDTVDPLAFSLRGLSPQTRAA